METTLSNRITATENLANNAIPKSMIREATNVTEAGYPLDARQNNATINNSLRYLADMAINRTTEIINYRCIKKVMGSNDDFNNYITPGTYVCNSDAVVMTIANRPPCNKSGRLEVKMILENSNYIHQLYIPYYGSLGIYLRDWNIYEGWHQWYHLVATT